MTITEANAANVIAADALNLAKHGVPVSKDVQLAIADLLRGAHRALNAGHDERSFADAFAAIEARNARRERRKAARV